MARWRRWVFEAKAPADEFSLQLQRGLAIRGVRVEPARHFDWVCRAFGARAYLKVAWADAGLEVVAKIKGGPFSAPAALEELLLDAGREAQARLVFRGGV